MKSFVQVLMKWVVGKTPSPQSTQQQLSAEEARLRLGQSTGVPVGQEAEYVAQYDNFKNQLLAGAFNSLLFLSPSSLERLPKQYQHDILLLKLSAQMQTGDLAAARALVRGLDQQGCPRHKLAQTMTAALVFSQARLHVLAGQVQQARAQFAEALSILHQGGVNTSELTDTWLRNLQKQHAVHGVVHA
jgi:hypothetical protein